ncbi:MULTISPECIES: serine--tRNA ligase [unclassified Bradyrhizobium]|uniref:serine--tRNA ligase n=1 Tax=unclassified Bradyrhizobium TaxID=2631580 RepID=UPI002916BD95|nr:MULTISPECIES: serine--tRNA ligase [unclassified Bradyrhizobium]
MHDIKSIRDNPQGFDAALTRRGLAPLSTPILELDERRRAAIGHLERALARRNAASKEIGEARKRNDLAHADDLMIEVAQLKKMIPELEKTPREIEAKLDAILEGTPNLPLDDVPEGKDEHDNVERHVFGKKQSFSFGPKPHDELGVGLGYMDFEAAAKLSGARFVVLRKGLARLERALGQFMLDLHTTEHGYTEVNPPLMVRSPAMFGTAQLPKFRDDQFQVLTDDIRRTEVRSALEVAIKVVENRGLDELKRAVNFPIEFGIIDRKSAKSNEKEPGHFWLIPTAEVALTNLVRESIVDEKELPMRLTALTPCFRAEAGAAGRDTRGMIRQHQFTKVELVSITTPETSKDEHERMLACAEEVLRRLDLHYRVITLCTGDMGFSSQKTYDIEVWMPGQGDGGAFREISSCSVCGDFQARRMDARYRGSDGKPRFVHTLNGSGTAVGRALIAVMETYQQADGSIAIPDVLQPYMGGLKVVAAEP